MGDLTTMQLRELAEVAGVKVEEYKGSLLDQGSMIQEPEGAELHEVTHVRCTSRIWKPDTDINQAMECAAALDGFRLRLEDTTGKEGDQRWSASLSEYFAYESPLEFGPTAELAICMAVLKVREGQSDG